MWYYERALESTAGKLVAHALQVPEGYRTTVYSLEDLDPITKIQEERFYQFVKDSIRAWGYLYHPLIVYPVSLDDWKKEMEMDPTHTFPKKRPDDLHLRIQCGCNRFFAVKELLYDAVECIVVPDLKEAQDLAHTLRVDKKWQRGSNMELLIKNLRG